MTYHDLAIIIGWIAVSFGIPATVAQWRRVETKGVEGVSHATWLLFVFMSCFWITYGFVAHSAQVTWGSLVCLPFQLAIVYRLKFWRRARVPALTFLFFLVSVVAPTLIWGWKAGVLGTGFAMVCNRGPQFIELIRESNATGVSTMSWLYGAMGCALWIIYYQNVHLWSALIATSGALAANLAICFLAAWRHRQAKNAMIADEVFSSSL